MTLVLASSSCVILANTRILRPNTMASTTMGGNVASINSDSFTDTIMINTVPTTSVVTCRKSSARVSENVS